MPNDNRNNKTSTKTRQCNLFFCCNCTLQIIYLMGECPKVHKKHFFADEPIPWPKNCVCCQSISWLLLRASFLIISHPHKKNQCVHNLNNFYIPFLHTMMRTNIYQKNRRMRVCMYHIRVTFTTKISSTL